jgi:hypothetical protein
MMPPQERNHETIKFSQSFILYFLKYIKKERQKSAEQPPGTIHSSI